MVVESIPLAHNLAAHSKEIIFYSLLQVMAMQYTMTMVREALATQIMSLKALGVLILAINGPLGPYGPARQCPGKTGAAADCGIIYTKNWLHTSAGGHGSGNNITVTGNTKIATSSPLPTAAAAIATDAGARY
eukprot:TRINITY_DN930_c0_g3_i1.p2 TRINITY_DN930_c0_g3~~TRINITY_DN930_c0_g3_i1.p2  ORF type:complete len:133 (+),score=22.27 TRINITY_DN930_c0_g3_i1:188-586(+)